MQNIVSASNFSLKYTIAFSIIGAIAVSLNLTEIILLWRKWKKLTHFEFILFNLAIADILTASTALATSFISMSIYVSKSTNIDVLYSVLHFLSFTVVSSTVFTLIIGIERLQAIKVPLKHRRLRSSRAKTTRYIMIAWAVNIILSSIFIITSLVVKKNSKISPLGTTAVSYVFGGFMLFGVCLIMIIYAWLLQLILKRNSVFLKYDKNDTSNKTKIVEAMRKEKAAVVACGIVVITYLGFNLPFTIKLFKLSKGMLDELLIIVLLNVATNPLIYFFKAYAERCFAKTKIHFSSDGKEDLPSKSNENDAQQSNGIAEVKNGKEMVITGIDRMQDEKTGFQNDAFTNV